MIPVLVILTSLLLNPHPSEGHVRHDCHVLHIEESAEQCSTVSAADLTGMGFDPIRDQAVAWDGIVGTGAGTDDAVEHRIVWVFVNYGDRVELIDRLAS